MKYSVIVVALGLFGAGCGWKSGRVHKMPEIPSPGGYEVTWAEPEVVVSDSLFTLIRSPRIDSFYVESLDPTSLSVPSLRFHIAEGACNVSVNLLDEFSRVEIPLLVRNLGPGFYKLTLHEGWYAENRTASTSCVLKADVCGYRRAVPVVLGR
ncbi:MAG: hypothetical protein JSU65_07550 [Candidatus Zixiibacteriota bacterium]|nr:MAG: hypothetical protein JSU65_07550 [candidate division Zixibacteria bacterium]